MLSYEKTSESAKQYDWVTASNTIKQLLVLGYDIVENRDFTLIRSIFKDSHNYYNLKYFNKMKIKLSFFLILILVPIFSTAQNNIISEVCGIKFGTSFDVAKDVLNKKYGVSSRISDDKNIIVYDNRNFEGKVFEHMYFVFENEDNYGFDYAVFTVVCKTKSEAEKEREDIAEIIKKKYVLETKRDIYGDIAYYGGTSPLNRERYGLKIEIIKDKITVTRDKKLSLKEDIYTVCIVIDPKMGETIVKDNTTYNSGSEDAETNSNLQHYIDIAQAIARIEHSHIKNLNIEYEELLSIGIIGVQVMIKNKTKEQLSKYNTMYIATALQWAIRNELKIRYKDYRINDIIIVNDSTSDELKKFSVRASIYRVIGELYNYKNNLGGSSFKEEILSCVSVINKQIEAMPLDADREIINKVIFGNKSINDIASEQGMSLHDAIIRINSLLDDIGNGLNWNRKIKEKPYSDH